MKELVKSNWSGWGIAIDSTLYQIHEAEDLTEDSKTPEDIRELLEFAQGHVHGLSRFNDVATGILQTKVSSSNQENTTADFDSTFCYTFVGERNRYTSLMVMMREICGGRSFRLVQNQNGNLRVCTVTATAAPPNIYLDSAMKMMLEAFGDDWARIQRIIERG